MNVDIKESTAMIKKGVIPDSHKKTKNMIIPIEWEEKRIKDICKINKKSLGTSTEEEYQFRYYDLSTIDNGKIYHPFEKIIFETAPSRARRVFQKYDILMSTVRPNLKGFAYIDFDANDCIASTGFAVLESYDQNDSQYVYQNLYSCGIEKQINRLLVGSNYPAINNDEVENLRIPYPEDRYERKKIGDILSVWDTAIELKEKLIEEKKKQKSSLMQKLLTGKVRLPGFEGEWDDSQLKDHFGRVTRKNSSSCQNVLTISAQKGLVNQEDYFNKSVASSNLDNYFLLKNGEFAYNKSYSNGYPMGAIKRLNEYDEGVVTTLYICFYIKNNEKSNGDYFEHYFDSGLLNTALTQIAHEGGRAHGLLNVSPKDFFGLKVIMPPSGEQKAIASVLNTTKKEIDLHEKELEALKKQKKGLMQLLLTGIVRVNVETN